MKNIKGVDNFMSDREQMNQEAQQQFSNAGRKAAEAGKSAIRGISNSRAGRKVKETASKIMKNMGKAIVKALVAALQIIISFLLPILIPVLIVAVVVMSFWYVWNHVFYDTRSTTGAFQKDSRSAYATVLYNEDGSVASVSTNFGNDLAALFYAKYAKGSYYYSVDDETQLHQGTVDNEIHDIDNREDLFILNPQLLSVLDQELNDPYKYPEQLIKPIYNTCLNKMEDGTYEQTDTSKCELKSLTDENGNLVVKSTQYGNVENFNNYSYTTVYEKTDNKIPGVWDWGLAPIFHYVSHENYSYASNLSVNTVEVVEDGEVIEKNINDLSNEEKSKYGYDTIIGEVEGTERVERGGKYDSNNQIPANETVYSIDNVVTFAGTIHNTTTTEDRITGSLNTVLTTQYTDEAIAPENLYSNVNVIKHVYDKNGNFIGNYNSITIALKTEDTTVDNSGNRSEAIDKCYAMYQSRPAELVKCIAQAVRDNQDTEEETTVSGVQMDDTFYKGKTLDDYVIKYDKTYDLKYTVGGTIYTNMLVYSDNDIDTSGLDDISYLSDYIANYATFVDIGDEDKEEYGCYNINSSSLMGVMTGSYLTSLENYKESGMTAEELINETQQSNLTLAKKVSSPQDCENNQLALRLDSGEMTSFYIDEMPDIQRLGAADAMGYNLVSDTENAYAQSTSGIKEDLVISISDKSSEVDSLLDEKRVFGDKTVEQIIGETAAKFRIDETLLQAIVYAQSKGDLFPKNTENLCWRTATGCGALGVKYTQDVVTYTDYTDNQNKFIMLSQVDFDEFDESLEVLCAILQSYLEKYGNNPFIAIQALDFGSDAIEHTLKVAAQEEMYGDDWSKYPMSDFRDIEWMYYRTYGKNDYIRDDRNSIASDAYYLEKVLSYLPASYRIDVWDGSSWQSQTWSFIETKTQMQKSAADQFTDTANRRLETHEDTIKKAWNLMFLNQKSYDSGVYDDLYSNDPYNMPTKARFITSDATTDYLQNRIIQLIFAYADGGEMEDYANMTEYDIKARIVDMFQIDDAINITSNYDISKLIPTGNVVKFAKKFYISRGYGRTYDYDLGRMVYNDDVKVHVGEKSEIYSMSDGVIQSVQREPDGTYTIGVDHSGTVRDKNGVDYNNTTTVIYYSNLEDASVNRGDEIAAGGLLGHARSDDGSIYIQAYQDNDIINAETIVEYVLLKYDPSAFRKLNGYTIDSDSFQPPVVKNFTLNASCPYYPGNFEASHGSFHGGVDIGFINEPTLGQKIVAPADSVVLWTHDGCDTYGYLGNKCGSPVGGNSVVLLSEVDGITYAMYFLHMQQNSVAVEVGDFVSQGQEIGRAGSSGSSTGPHLHYEIFSLGDMGVEAAIEYYKNTGSPWFLNGKSYSDLSTFCDGITDKLCRINPAELFGWEIGGRYEGQTER